MKVNYRGYEIEAWRERALGGWDSIYYSIFRESDQYECDSGFSAEDETPIREFVDYLTTEVDNELAKADPWGERLDKLMRGEQIKEFGDIATSFHDALEDWLIELFKSSVATMEEMEEIEAIIDSTVLSCDWSPDRA